MAVASFEDLCAGFCEIVKVPLPVLKADDRGLVAFHVVLRDATVNLVHRPDKSPDHVFILFEFGPVGLNGPASFAELQALLEANFALLEVHTPVISRNPANGEAVMQCVYPLFEATPSGLYELIDTGIDQASQWRKDLSLRSPDGSDPTAAESSAQAMSNFSHQSMRA